MSENGSYNVAVVPGAVGIESGIAVVELIDTPETIKRGRRYALRTVRELLDAPADATHDDLVEAVSDIAWRYGPGARVVFSTGDSLDLTRKFRDAHRRRPARGRMLRNWTAPVTIVAGTSFTRDLQLGGYRIGDSELVTALRQQVKGGEFRIDPDADPGAVAATIAAATTMALSVAPAGTLRFPQRANDGRVFALALGLYPELAPGAGQRRYLVPPLPQTDNRSVLMPSLVAAINKYGNGVTG